MAKCIITNRDVSSYFPDGGVISYMLQINNHKYNLTLDSSLSKDLSEEHKYILSAWLFNNAWPFDEGVKLTRDLVDRAIRQLGYPIKGFDNKLDYFILNIYLNGGNEYKDFKMILDEYLWAFANSKDEFSRILRAAMDNELIEKIEPAHFIIGDVFELFSELALSTQHILIQKFASDIALNIETSFPGTYEHNILASLKNLGKSEMLVQEKEYNYSTDSYLHKDGQIKTDIDFRFGWDFDRYWFEPLGDVFGVTQKQIQEIAANLVVKEWGLEDNNGYNKDPRLVLWNRSSHERETWHDHGRYPRTDNLDFYLSYHAMLVVAARLIKNMPVIKTRDWPKSPWEDWISNHLLTQEAGKWLADYRDPLPMNRPKWISENKKATWPTDIAEEDFLNSLKTEENGELWINVKGHWSEKDNERTETFSISTALVSTTTADSLMHALATCSDPHDYKLPYFEENDMEIHSDIFQLKGWINERNISKGLDEYDHYADEINYPPYSLGTAIVERLGLLVNQLGNNYSDKQSKAKVLSCETWSSYSERRDEEPDQKGMRLKASLSFLKHLCTTLGYDLIFEVSINREINYKYNRDEREYSKPQHKIFILSADGNFRTTS